MSSPSLLRSYSENAPIRHTVGRDTAYGVVKTVDASIRYKVIEAAWGTSYESLRDFGAAHYHRLHQKPPALENYPRSCQVYQNGAWQSVQTTDVTNYPVVTDFHLYHEGIRYNALRHSDTGAVYVYTADTWDYIGIYNPISNTIQSQTVEPSACLAFRTCQDGHIAEDVAESVLQTSTIVHDAEATITIRRKGELDSWAYITFYNAAGSWYASERKSWGEMTECNVTADYLELMLGCLRSDDDPNHPIELVELYVPGFPEVAMTRESFQRNAGLVERCLKAFMDL